MPAKTPARRGRDAAAVARTLSTKPGVYRLLDAQGRILYVGKAKNLRRRVASYFSRTAHDAKTSALVQQVASVEVTVTGTEADALLLEYNLIKAHRPRFNVVLRDDKSYPYIYISTQQDFPRIEFHRGSRRKPGRFFGPFPNAGAVRASLIELQKLFRLRTCADSFFLNRSRPCLQYQIGRCSAPCVSLIDQESYLRDVQSAMQFVQGRNEAVLADLTGRMERAAESLDFELAARIRDQVAAVRRIQSAQVVVAPNIDEADFISVAIDAGSAVVAVLTVRGGRLLGSRVFAPRVAPGTEPPEIVTAFLAQHYLAEPAPAELIAAEVLADRPALETVLSQHASHPVQIRDRVRGHRARLLQLATRNAAEALAMRAAAGTDLTQQLAALAASLGIRAGIARLECFDISHTGGEGTVASCVVFGTEGPIKSAYRRFNIAGITPGDDYAAIEQAVARRYSRQRREGMALPDLILVDGGKSQLEKAIAALDALNLGEIPVAAVAKGRDRKPGFEQVFFGRKLKPVVIPRDSPALLVVQRIRDEAHRFAITGHRQRRSRSRAESPLQTLPGVGPKRRRALLQAFGGLQGLRRASVSDLTRVKGVSTALAERIVSLLQNTP